MEDGGTDFFDFVVHSHEVIESGALSLKKWRKHCKFMMAQMVQSVRWLHSELDCCHLDLSLENFLISKHAKFDAKSGKMRNLNLKLIDFGLTQRFDTVQNPQRLSRKFVGKTHYKAPQIYAKEKAFRADLADVWSLGICLFMLAIGAPPYNKPLRSDDGFRYLEDNKMRKLLFQWGRIKYVTPNLDDLLEGMLCVAESKRMNMAQLTRHPWLSVYFPAQKVKKSSAACPLSPILSSTPSHSMSARPEFGVFEDSASATANPSMRILIPSQVSASESANGLGTPRSSSVSRRQSGTSTFSLKSANSTPTPIAESSSNTNHLSFADCHVLNEEFEAVPDCTLKKSVEIELIDDITVTP